LLKRFEVVIQCQKETFEKQHFPTNIFRKP
jgi:hypothetical protein